MSEVGQLILLIIVIRTSPLQDSLGLLFAYFHHLGYLFSFSHSFSPSPVPFFVSVSCFLPTIASVFLFLHLSVRHSLRNFFYTCNSFFSFSVYLYFLLSFRLCLFSFSFLYYLLPFFFLSYYTVVPTLIFSDHIKFAFPFLSSLGLSPL
jgi:hypothetical protein